MPSRDRDVIEKERINSVMSKVLGGQGVNTSEFFRSERIANSLDAEKTLLYGYNKGKILATAPFSPSVLVTLCPKCIERGDFKEFKILVESKLIVPVLGSNYGSYPSEVADFIWSHDHMSSYEFHAFRYLGITKSHGSMLCKTCAANQFQRISEIVSKRNNGERYGLHVDAIRSNVYPYVDPDSEILDLAEQACRRRKLRDLATLERLSFAIRDARTSQAFGAPIIVDQAEIELLPQGILQEFNEAKLSTSAMRREVAEGLGLTIPTDIPIEKYAEIVRDYRVDLVGVINEVALDSTSNDAYLRLQKKVADINEEIDRVKNLKRYQLLRATLRSFGKNEAIIRASFVGAALGWINPILGCAGAGTVVIGKLLRKNKFLEENPEARRLCQSIARDIKPYTNAAMKYYLGADEASVRVLSIQNVILEAKSARAKAA